MKALVFSFESSFPVARVGLAIYDQSKNSIFAAESFVGLNFLADPPRFCGTR
jgi:hypothetical protein